jgi:phosphatidylethanolamine/phosphatidyl-N-methylethanolamine N-methyltransferase
LPLANASRFFGAQTGVLNSPEKTCILDVMSEYRLFFREFLRNHYTTGAVLPSGRALAGALARFVAEPGEGRRRILEVGPGTGAVTRRIVDVLRPADLLDLVELNDSFVRRLEDRFQNERRFQSVADRTRILHCPVEELPLESTYDLIISGLPLNNFSADLVEKILHIFLELLTPGGTLSFFEYIAMRKMKALVSGAEERRRLRGVRGAMQNVLKIHEFRREAVLLNVPPAWVHHVRRFSTEER